MQSSHYQNRVQLHKPCWYVCRSRHQLRKHLSRSQIKDKLCLSRQRDERRTAQRWPQKRVSHSHRKRPVTKTVVRDQIADPISSLPLNKRAHIHTLPWAQQASPPPDLGLTSFGVTSSDQWDVSGYDSSRDCNVLAEFHLELCASAKAMRTRSQCCRATLGTSVRRMGSRPVCPAAWARISQTPNSPQTPDKYLLFEPLRCQGCF